MRERTLLWVCAIVLALGAGIGLGFGSYLYPKSDSATQREEPRQSGPGNATPTAIVSGNGAGQENPPCKPGQDNRASDLCAQWKAADAAAASAYWDRFIAVLTVAGLVVGAATLGAAGAAAVFARRAANHAHRSADTANDALIADTRAWLALKAVTISYYGLSKGAVGDNLSVNVSIWVQNYGRGPALDCDVRVGWKRRGHEEWGDDSDPIYVRRMPFDALMPGDGKSDLVVSLTDPFDEVFISGCFILVVVVSYRIVGVKGRRITRQVLTIGDLDPGLGDTIPVTREELRERRPRLGGTVDRTEMT